MKTLINMELSAADAKKLTEPDPADAPKYPWGLELRLEDEQLKKLGITDLPKTGSKLQLVASVEVCGTHETDSQRGGERRSVELQVTAMALSADTSDTPAAEQLYKS